MNKNLDQGIIEVTTSGSKKYYYEDCQGHCVYAYLHHSAALHGFDGLNLVSKKTSELKDEFIVSIYDTHKPTMHNKIAEYEMLSNKEIIYLNNTLRDSPIRKKSKQNVAGFVNQGYEVRIYVHRNTPREDISLVIHEGFLTVISKPGELSRVDIHQLLDYYLERARKLGKLSTLPNH